MSKSIGPVWQGVLIAYFSCVSLSVLTLAGCGGASEAGTVSVTGTVSLDGKPLDGASIAFISNGGSKLATALTDSAGKFTIRAGLGSNQVTVSKGAPPIGPPPSEEEMLMPTEQELQSRPPPPESGVPARYGDPKTSGIVIEVVEGMQAIDVSLSSS
jgi:hypothetical protein